MVEMQTGVQRIMLGNGRGNGISYFFKGICECVFAKKEGAEDASAEIVGIFTFDGWFRSRVIFCCVI